MELVDLPPPPQMNPTDGGSVDRNRLSKRWALVAAVLCPCHLWLVAGIIGFFGAGATADAIRDNQPALVLVLAPLSAFALWRAVAAGRKAATMRRAGVRCATATEP
jgi:hypothetical protein